MRKIVFAVVLSGVWCWNDCSYAQRPDWKPLEVSESDVEIASVSQNDGSAEAGLNRFERTVSGLRENIEKKQQENKRTVKAVSREEVFSAIQEMYEKSYPGGVDQMLADNQKIEDNLYQLLKMLPDYAFQYVAPFLHTLPYMSDRILNMPGVKGMKGKFPTRIAPQMKEYAKKYGKTMSPHYYLYLMPEAFPAQDREKALFKGYQKSVPLNEKTKVTDLFLVNQASLLNDFPMPSPEAYQTGSFLTPTKHPQTPSNKVTLTSSLTEGDVGAVLDSLSTLKKTFGSDRLDKFHVAIRDMSLTDNNLEGELLNPMQTLVSKIKRLPESQQFTKAVSQHGFTPDTWGITVDKMLKAQRVAKMSTGTALSLQAWRKPKTMPASFNVLSDHDKQVAWDSIGLFLGLYTTTQENLLAVKNYSDNIRDAFATRDMTFMEAPVFGIY